MHTIRRRWLAGLVTAAVAGAALLSATPAAALDYQEFDTTLSGTVSVVVNGAASTPAAGVSLLVFAGTGPGPFDWDSDFDGIPDNIWWGPGARSVTTDANGRFEVPVHVTMPAGHPAKVQLWMQSQTAGGVSYQRASSELVIGVPSSRQLDWTVRGSAAASAAAAQATR